MASIEDLVDSVKGQFSSEEMEEFRNELSHSPAQPSRSDLYKRVSDAIDQVVTNHLQSMGRTRGADKLRSAILRELYLG